jgi:uncharacterized membrane protein YbhN (UPF0104 family)
VADDQARPWLRLPVRRLVWLALAAIAFYVLWPRLFGMFTQVPRLTGLSVWWFLAGCGLEALSLACAWSLFRLAMGDVRWSLCAATQLSSYAFSRLVPGGAAAAGSVTFQMLTWVGHRGPRIFTALTVTSLLTNAVVLALPLLSLPMILSGAAVAPALTTAAAIGGGVFLLILGIGAVLLTTDSPLDAIGRAVQYIRNRLRRRHPPITDLPATLVIERNVIREVLGRRWWEGLVFTTGRWLFDFCVLLAALAAVGARPRPALVLLAYVVAALLGMLPFTPGGLGFVEIGLAATLQWAGVGPAEAVLATLAYRAVSFWLPIPVGMVTYAVFRRRHGPGAEARRSDG